MKTVMSGAVLGALVWTLSAAAAGEDAGAKRLEVKSKDRVEIRQRAQAGATGGRDVTDGEGTSPGVLDRNPATFSTGNATPGAGRVSAGERVGGGPAARRQSPVTGPISPTGSAASAADPEAARDSAAGARNPGIGPMPGITTGLRPDVRSGPDTSGIAGGGARSRGLSNRARTPTNALDSGIIGVSDAPFDATDFPGDHTNSTTGESWQTGSRDVVDTKPVPPPAGFTREDTNKAVEQDQEEQRERMRDFLKGGAGRHPVNWDETVDAMSDAELKQHIDREAWNATWSEDRYGYGPGRGARQAAEDSAGSARAPSRTNPDQQGPVTEQHRIWQEELRALKPGGLNPQRGGDVDPVRHDVGLGGGRSAREAHGGDLGLSNPEGAAAGTGGAGGSGPAPDPVDYGPDHVDVQTGGRYADTPDLDVGGGPLLDSAGSGGVTMDEDVAPRGGDGDTSPPLAPRPVVPER
ncbi:MAG: hypothetical protein U5Q16_13155 [Gammaproteobacteria bacterium]|nr:hypothetical protein [Gammaproteobacteria bacterium]